MPDIGFINGLARAVARGVDVRVLVPVASDSLLADLTSRASFARLLKLDPALPTQSVAHSKALLVDREFVSIGTTTSTTSLVYNLELVVNALDRDCNEALEHVVEDMAAGTEIRWEEFCRRPLLTRILERLAYGFATLVVVKDSKFSHTVRDPTVPALRDRDR